MTALAVAPAWRERLQARADAPPLRPRVPLWWQGHCIGSVEPDLFARAGVIDWSAELSAPNIDVRSKDDGTDLAYGVGAQFRILSLSLRAEYERYEIADTDKVDMVSIGMTYTFF